MRLEVDLHVGEVGEGETGRGELARVLMVAALAVEDGILTEAGDEFELFDLNNDPLGTMRLVPDWSVGEKVWATTREGSLVKGTIMSVTLSLVGDGFFWVRCYSHTGEPMTAVQVDHRGFGRSGEPYLGRMR